MLEDKAMIINEDVAVIINNAASDQTAPDNQMFFQEAEGNLLKQWKSITLRATQHHMTPIPVATPGNPWKHLRGNLEIYNFEGDQAPLNSNRSTWESMATQRP